MKKRIISVLLVLLMIVGMFPAVSLAATGATIVVKKVDESGAPLAGAVITMSQRIDGVQDYTATSDANGLATFRDVPDGAGYYIWESRAPAGYALSDDIYMLDIADGAGIVYGEPGEGFPNGQKAYDNNDPFVFVNEEYKASFYVTKTDGTAPLAGASFQLESNIAGRVPYTAVSDEAGKVTFNDVIDGYYTLSEIQAPAGYEKSDNVIYFKVENGEVKYSVDRNLYTPYYNTLSIQNTKIPTAKIELTKTDAQDVPLAGAVFHLTEEGKNEPAYEAVSDADGRVRFEVVSGTYILSEYMAPVGYEKITETYKFKVDATVSGRPVQLYENGSYYDYEGLLTIANEELVLPPATTTIVIKKTDDKGAPVAGAIFHLTEGGQPEPAYEATSDANGIVTFDKVVQGYYSLSEYMAPVGFIKSEERYNFYVTAEGDVRIFTEASPNGAAYVNDSPLVIVNNPTKPAPDPNAKGAAKLTKVDAGDPKTVLAGVCFDLYNAAGKKLGSYVTNKKGVISVSGLKAGNYYWVETQPSEGYKLDNTPQNFTVVGGETTSLVVRNSKTPVPTVFTDDHYAYIIGREDGLVHPEDNVTRAEVATIFFRLLNEKTRSKNMTKKNDFTDVKKGAWYNTAVSTMAAMGIINGRPDGSFGPDDPITRAEFAAIAARFEVKGNTTGASFNDIYKHWAKKEINIAANNGWVLGYEDGTFRPDQVISRVEAMTMVNRVLQRIPETVEDLHPDMVTWPDNQNTKAWYYRVVQEATNSHNYVRKANGYEHWTGMRANPDWSALEK